MAGETTRYAAAVAAGTIVGAVALFAIGSGREIDVAVSPKTGVSFKTAQGKTLTELIADGIDATRISPGDSEAVIAEKTAARQEFNAVLASRGYYDIDDPAFVEAIRNLDTKSPVAHSIRKVLYDLAGPFGRPVTFREADGRLWDAFEDLRSGLTEDPEGDSTFFAELYARLLDENSILGAFNNQISARIELVDDQSAKATIYTCPGSDLKQGTFVTVRADIRKGGWLDDEVHQDIRVHQCPQQLCFLDVLSGATVSLGANRAAFDAIFPAAVPDLAGIRAAGEGPAKVIVYPMNLAPRVLLGQN